MKFVSKSSLTGFAIYLAFFLVVVLIHFIWQPRYFESALFFPVPTLFAILVYFLYGLPIIWFFIVIYRFLRYGTSSLKSGMNVSLVLLVLALCTHSVYWAFASLIKMNIYSRANPVEKEFNKELDDFSVTPVSIRHGELNGRGFHNYVMEVSVSNPLPRDVNIYIDSTAAVLRVKNNSVYQDVGTRRLYRGEVVAGYEGPIEINISNSLMRDILSENKYMEAFALIDMRYSGKEREVLSDWIDISHALCKWSVLGCPDYSGSYGLGPFSDNKIWDRSYQVHARSRRDFVDLEIFRRISKVTYEFEGLKNGLEGDFYN